MPALRRRTRFAAPLVITLVTGCGKGEPERTHNPPPPPAQPFSQTWQVTRANSGDCWAEQDVRCAPDETCNPPPPKRIECPAGIAKTPVTVARLPDFNCAVVPAGCDTPTCAQPATPCPK